MIRLMTSLRRISRRTLLAVPVTFAFVAGCDEDLVTGGAASSESSSDTPSERPSTPTPTPTPTRAEGVYQFGETVTTTVRLSIGYVDLDVTVDKPKQFTPTDPSDATQNECIYFPLTVTNRSADVYTLSFMFSETYSGLDSDPKGHTSDGTKGDAIRDSDQGIVGIDGSPKIEPGKSYRCKVGFSVAQTRGITYELRTAGRAGDTLYFQE